VRKVREDHQRGFQTCKFCVACSRWIPLCDFYTDRAKADGLRAYYKACYIAKAKR
jgi:hypothetical protein